MATMAERKSWTSNVKQTSEMSMKIGIVLATLSVLLPAAALAAGSHRGGHDDMMAIGKPGTKAKAGRTVDIVMAEKDDGAMVFEPAALKVKAGETIRLKFTNKGATDHEFVMDTGQAVLEHKAEMAKFPEMEHADPNSLRLALARPVRQAPLPACGERCPADSEARAQMSSP
jgi:uncharacterized cupredoxin-like copper-binding protein